MSNPTSNFGWQMPTNTDLVSQLPADFEVFGQAVDTSLADLKGGTTGQVLKKNSNTDMDFVWAADAAGMTNPMTTTGDTIYSSSGSTPVRLGIGTANQVLTVNSGGTAPEWKTPAGGGGKVLQVLSTTKTDTFSTSSTSFTDVTGLSISITPTANTSKILVMATVNGTGEVGTNVATIKLLRGATDIFVGDTSGSRTSTSSDFYGNANSQTVFAGGTYLDSPATTSSTTYKIQIKCSSAGNAYVNRTTLDTDSSVFSRTASSITVMEIGA